MQERWKLVTEGHFHTVYVLLSFNIQYIVDAQYTDNSINAVGDNSQMYNMRTKRMMGIIIVLNMLTQQ